MTVPSGLLLAALLGASRAAPGNPDRPGHFRKVFVIVMENQGARAVYRGAADPYLTGTLMARYAHATSYETVAHPSEPNYVWLEAGSNDCGDHVFTTDHDPDATNSTSTTQHLSTLLEHAGRRWREYAADAPAGRCPLTRSGEYVPKHVAQLFFRDVVGDPPSPSSASCLAHVFPFGQLGRDLESGSLPDYAFITPNLIDDMHDGSIADGDRWLRTNPIVQRLIAYVTDPANRAFLAILWDECEDCHGATGPGSNQPMLLVTAPRFLAGGRANATPLSHSSFVKSVQEVFGLTPAATDPTTGRPFGWLRHAGDPSTRDFSTFFAPGQFP